MDDKRTHHLQEPKRHLFPEVHRMRLRNDESREDQERIQHQNKQPPLRLPNRIDIRRLRPSCTCVHQEEQSEVRTVLSRTSIHDSERRTNVVNIRIIPTQQRFRHHKSATVSTLTPQGQKVL